MDARTLKRIHRVRELQLTLAQADEMRARDKVDAELALQARIAALAAAVAPAPVRATAVALGAEAHFRERLLQSEQAAQNRVATAERLFAKAGDATRAARQDRTAVEKLLDRARHELVAREMRALEEMPSAAKRHDAC